MMDLTGGLCVLAQLKLNASVKLSGDQTVGYNHHHSRDEEQSEQEQHIPEKQPEWKERGVETAHTHTEELQLNPSSISPQNQPNASDSPPTG